MSESKIIESMKEALAIANQTLPADSWRVHIPADLPRSYTTTPEVASSATTTGITNDS